MSRLLAYAATAVLLLAGCSASAPKITPAQVFADAANALTVLQADVALIPGLKPETVAMVQDDAARGLAVLHALSAEAPAVEGAKAIAQAEGYLNAALMTLPAQLPAPYNLYVAAAAAIVPSLEAYVASLTTPPAGAPIGVAQRARGMSPSEGSAILKTAVRSH